MHEDPARSINPNTLYGCHPLDLRSKFGDHPFHLIIKQPEAPLPKVSSRLRLLEKILNDISRCDLPAKNHFADFMRQRYRRNCKPNTLRSASTGPETVSVFFANDPANCISSSWPEKISRRLQRAFRTVD